jgi:hypothetical protein
MEELGMSEQKRASASNCTMAESAVALAITVGLATGCGDASTKSPSADAEKGGVTAPAAPAVPVSAAATEFDVGRRVGGSSDATDAAGDAKGEVEGATRIADIVDDASFLEACTRGTRVRKSFTLSFPATSARKGTICELASDGTDDTIRGALSQEQVVELPPGALACTKRFTASRTPARNGRWVYDDEVVLTLGGVVLMASQRGYLWRDAAERTGPIMTGVADGYLFDWQRLAGLGLWNERGTIDRQYCYGGDSSACELPVSETPGDVRLTLDRKAFAGLGRELLRKNELRYDLWVTGDNDMGIDCRHSGLTIEGDVEYVVLQP